MKSLLLFYGKVLSPGFSKIRQTGAVSKMEETLLKPSEDSRLGRVWK